MSLPFIIVCILALLLVLLVKNIKWFSRGAAGERTVSEKLQNLGEHYIVIDDLLIPNAHGDTQIDHVVVSPFGIFVIETKCWSGWITGGENSSQWTQTIYKEKYEKPNPIFQNKVHVEAVKSALKQYGEVLAVPIVVVVDCERLKVNAPNHTVIMLYSLKEEILKYHKIIYTDEQCESMALRLRELSSDDKERREEHIQKVRAYQVVTQAKVKNGICPRCGGELVLRNGRYGRFYGCTNYPICKFISKT